MDCKKIDHIVVDILTVGASENDLQFLQAHFSECSQCRKQFIPILAMNKTFENIPQCDVPIGFDERFREKLSAQKKTTALLPLLKLLVEIFSTNVRFALISIVGALLSFLGPIESVIGDGTWNIVPTFLLAISLLIISFVIKQPIKWGTLIFLRRKIV